MAVAFDAVTTSDNAGSPASFSHTASGSNRLAVAMIVFQKDSTAVNGTPTYGGSNMTKFTEFDPVGAADAIGKIEIWYIVAPALLAQTVSIAWTATGDDAIIAVASFTGVDQTTPLSGAATAEGNSTTPSVAVVSGTDDLVVDVVESEGLSSTAGASQTERVDTTSGGAAGHITVTTEPGAVSVTMSETLNASAKWAKIGFNVEAVAAGLAGHGLLLSHKRNRLVQMAA